MEERTTDVNRTSDKEGENASQHEVKKNAVGSLARNIDLSLTSIPIILCCFCSGLIDSVVFNAWGVFATMQTGNTIILALGASYQPKGHPHAWLQALMAITFFFFGSFFTNRVANLLSALRHTTLFLSFLLQTGLIVTAAALVSGHIVPNIGDTEPFITLVPIPMLSFQAGMQSVTARQFGLNEIPTTVLTSVYCDLGNDEKLFDKWGNNWKRNRRIGAAVSLIIGAIIGGWLSRTGAGMTPGLWMAAAVKACISVGWLVWKSEKRD